MVLAIAALAAVSPDRSLGEQVAGRHAEGLVHGFLILRTLDGTALADGDLSEQMDLPVDVANGMVLTILKNARPDAPPKSVGFVAATPKPRLVKLAISPAGDESFVTGGTTRKAMRYVLKVEIGGVAGVVAPFIGKQPPDSHVWILGGEAPAFVKSEQPLYNEGPVWRIELTSPVWPK